MSHILQQAFGNKDVDLYTDVLKVKKDCTLSQLRKAYFKQALVYHPDKNPSEDAKIKFQAISWAYQLLKDPVKRDEYDKYGAMPFDDDDGGSDDDSGSNLWRSYFDNMFGKVSMSRIDEFALKYKMSEEEENDVLLNYEKFKGDLKKMLEHVILSEEKDALRWVEDYIRPAIQRKEVIDHSKTLESSLRRIQQKIAGTEKQKAETKAAARCSRQKKDTTKSKVVKARATKTKQKNSTDDDLVAAIRNRGRGSNALLASLGARYGASLDHEDPLDDETFATIQKQLRKK